MNWADHCDSDSDSDDGLHPVRFSSSNLAGQSNDADEDAGISFDEDEDSIAADEELELEEEEIPFPSPIDMNNLPENFPAEAPYSAYVGNVAFNIKSEQVFAEKIEGLVELRYQNTKRVKVINARFGMDRATNQRKGFGYVEFETPEELMLVLNLNDGHSSIHNRNVNIDIARPPQKRNNNRRNNNNRNNNRDRGDNSNGKLPKIDGSKFKGGLKQKERTSLKLNPRSTKPAENKPSDTNDWRSEKATLPERKRNNNRKKNNNAKKNDKKDNKKDNATPAVVPKKVQAPLPVKEDKKNFTKVSNTFAAFGFDSDSDSD